MDHGHGGQPAARLVEGRLHPGIVERARLQLQEGGDQLQAVLDPVVDLPQQVSLLLQ